LIQAFDVFILLIFVPVQWRITKLWLRAARRRSGGWSTAWVRAVFVLDALLATGWLLDFLPAVGAPVIPGLLCLVLRTGMLAYGYFATAVLAILAVFRRLRKAVGAEFNPGRRRVLNTAGHLAIAAPFAVLSYGALIERLDFRVREVDVPIPGLPDDLDGLRIVHLSDIHLSPFLSEEQLSRVIDAANGLHPHLAAITGDLISDRDDPIDACIRQLARLKADAGVVACMGNHEHYARLEDYTAGAAARVGIPFLRGQSRALRFGKATLNVAGVDYQPFSDKAGYLRGAGRLVVPGETNLLLSHNPDVFPVAAHQGYNLMLAGHTHGGQVSVEILDQAINPARFFTHYVYGLFRRGAAAGYVTRGIGTIGIPARIGAPPEISLLRLRKA
jgi:predicted MPP superfamily phosphohydrolase